MRLDVQSDENVQEARMEDIITDAVVENVSAVCEATPGNEPGEDDDG